MKVRDEALRRVTIIMYESGGLKLEDLVARRLKLYPSHKLHPLRSTVKTCTLNT